MKFTKLEWERTLRKRVHAFQAIATELGKEHAITKMMGQLAWGRHDWEYGPDYGLQNVIVAAAALDGVFKVLNCWARDNDYAAQRVLVKHYHANR